MKMGQSSALESCVNMLLGCFELFKVGSSIAKGESGVARSCTFLCRNGLLFQPSSAPTSSSVIICKNSSVGFCSQKPRLRSESSSGELGCMVGLTDLQP